MPLIVRCRHLDGCNENVRFDGPVSGAGGALRRRPTSAVQREVVFLECPAGHVERYEIELYPYGDASLVGGGGLLYGGGSVEGEGDGSDRGS
jgi:hypothetical protein